MGHNKSHPLVGKQVTVYWKDTDCDWKNYEVLYFVYPVIGLQGLKQGNIEFTGRPIWIHFDSIEMIEEGLYNGS